uniref:Variant surface glycoprotein 1125.4069 n=1 Tax=Trypanosoma brucei TaxID=5691 RepID=A0A1J0RA65_9TRYP|nr:variant surface glycoprotein 1125.4069 [Trypanosoma brucei]
MNCFAIAFALTLALNLWLRPGEATAGDGANIAEFNILCQAVLLEDADPTVEICAAAVTDAEVNDIIQLNDSAAADSWYSKFPREYPVEEPTAKTAGRTGISDEKRCIANWMKWAKAKADLLKRATTETHLNPSKLNKKQTGASRYIAATQLLAAEAERELSEYNSIIKPKLVKENNAITTAIKAALYGKGATAYDGTDAKTMGTLGTRNTDCKTPAAGKSIVGDLFCLCAVDSTQSSAKPCGFDTASAKSSDWQTLGTNHKKATWADIKTACKHRPKPKLSEDTLRSIQTKFLSKLKGDPAQDGTSKAAAYLWSHNNGECGAANAARCVDYGLALKPTSGAGKIAWYDELTNAVNAAATWKKACDDNVAYRQWLKTLQKQAHILYDILSVDDTTQSQQKSGTTEQAQKHGTKKDCTKLEKAECNADVCCKYNETTNKCEEYPKSTVVQANKETGKTDKSVKCSEYGSKDKCEEVNKGKEKPVCAWRKGNDSEDNKGTEGCRNGSFLLNKKFTLMDAAFVKLAAS